MRYLIKNQDDSVSVVTVLPCKATILQSGVEVDLVGMVKKEGKTIVYGTTKDSGMEITVGDDNYNIADLEENTIPGIKFEFYDIQKDVIDKYLPETKAKIQSRRKISRSEIPQDRTFRDAWADKGNKIDVDMPKAREIHREHLRRLRKPILDQLDVDYMRADEAKDNKKKAEITARKQELRDVTALPQIDSAQTPEELKEVGKELL